MLLALLAGCSSPGPKAACPTSELLRVRPELPGEACPAGGWIADRGRDRDCDGALDDTEVESTRRVCRPAVVGCGGSKGALALSFDDDHVEQWYDARDVLRRHDARVTFYVTRPHRLDEEAVRMLQALAADGHEIACHGLEHRDADRYVAEHGMDAYLRDEIDPAVAALVSFGLPPATFAYPRNARTEAIDTVLLQRFRLLRGTTGLPSLRSNLTSVGPPRVLFTSGIDATKATTREVLAALDLVAERRAIGLLYAHRILEEPDPARDHLLRAELDHILAHARDLDLAFCRMDELLEPPRPPGREVIYGWYDEGSLASADDILQDVWPIPRFEPARLSWPYTWREDPYGEKYWQFIFYSLRETRHLLHAFLATGERRYRDKLEALFLHFAATADGSPFARDRHGTAFRAMASVNTYFKLRDVNALPAEMEAALRGLVARDGAFLADPDNFEGDYNHGVTEAAALLLVAVNFPELPQAAAWRDLARRRIAGLIADTVDADGAQIEQSPYYHFYVLRMFWQLDAWARRAGVDLTDLHDTVLAMIRFGARVLQPDAVVPMIGSSTLADLDRSWRDLAAGAAALDPGFAFVVTRGAQGTAPSPASVLFPATGLAVLRSGFGDAASAEQQTQVLFDVGPYRTAHSHLDALSVHLFAAGRTLLVDPGLFTYEPGPARDFYRSTRAHNTVAVDGADQAEGSAIAGELRTGEGWSWQSGRHHLYPGVEHRRGVLLLDRDRLLVIDHLLASRGHLHEQGWHLPPGVEVGIAGTSARVMDAAGEPLLALAQALPGGLQAEVVEGAHSPRQGWISSRYEIEEPAPVLLYRRTASEAWFVTALALGPRAADPLSVTASLEGVDLTVDVISGEDTRRVRARSPGGANESIEVR